MYWYVKAIKNYVNFKGRARRKEYWVFTVFNLIVNLGFFIVIVVGIVLGSVRTTYTRHSNLFHGENFGMHNHIGAMTYASHAQSGLREVGLAIILFGLVCLVVYSLFIIIPSLAVTVRRLHDTNRSGWWIFISLVPQVGPIVLFIFTILDSTPGNNKFGPNPKGVESIAEAEVGF